MESGKRRERGEEDVLLQTLLRILILENILKQLPVASDSQLLIQVR
jgi:hypothetical protein